jgi:hypothetical protein
MQYHQVQAYHKGRTKRAGIANDADMVTFKPGGFSERILVWLGKD